MATNKNMNCLAGSSGLCGRVSGRQDIQDVFQPKVLEGYQDIQDIQDVFQPKVFMAAPASL